MKKLILSILAIFGFTVSAYAATPGVFAVSATVPAATDVTFIVNKVQNGPPVTFEPVAKGSSAPLVWGVSDLTFDTTNKIWLGKHFFAIDLSPSKGVSGDPAPGNYGSVTFSFTGETVPPGQAAGDGLSKRAVLTAVRVAGTVETTIRGPERLGAVSALPAITQANVAGGFLRVYVGLYTGLPVVSGAVPPTNGDAPGTYGGTLTITATLV